LFISILLLHSLIFDLNELDYDIDLNNSKNDESLQSVSRILKKAAQDSEFRKSFFLNHQEILRELGVSDEIKYIIVRCLSDLTS
jgi:hypothetical protein